MVLSVPERLYAVQLILSRYVDPYTLDQVSLVETPDAWEVTHPDFQHCYLLLKDYDLLKSLGATILKRDIISVGK